MDGVEVAYRANRAKMDQLLADVNAKIAECEDTILNSPVPRVVYDARQNKLYWTGWRDGLRRCMVLIDGNG